MRVLLLICVTIFVTLTCSAIVQAEDYERLAREYEDVLPAKRAALKQKFLDAYSLLNPKDQKLVDAKIKEYQYVSKHGKAKTVFDLAASYQGADDTGRKLQRKEFQATYDNMSAESKSVVDEQVAVVEGGGAFDVAVTKQANLSFRVPAMTKLAGLMFLAFVVGVVSVASVQIIRMRRRFGTMKGYY